MSAHRSDMIFDLNSLVDEAKRFNRSASGSGGGGGGGGPPAYAVAASSRRTSQNPIVPAWRG